MTSDYLDLPIDVRSADRLAARGLRFALVDADDKPVFAAWSQAVSRGFHGEVMTEEKVEQLRTTSTGKRISGVWDDTGADPSTPVATVDSWVAEVTVPGGVAVRAWAVSAVTVAPTHRRRGIASALLEAELHTAKAAGCAVAVLTVSESTIYGRFGFAPAAMVSELTIDTRRARWVGPEASGRVHFVTADQLVVDGLALVERVRLASPGEISYSGHLWERQLGLSVGDETAKSLRFVRYDDADSVQQGFAIFRLSEDKADYTRHTLELATLVAVTDDAAAGLWRFLLEQDLVATISAGLRPVDDPIRWMVADYRAVSSRTLDHLWVRILDVAAALEGRRYARPGSVVLAIDDPLGLAGGVVTLTVDTDGRGVVERTPDAQADVTLSVNDLGAVYLGGVAATTLARAGRLTGNAALLDELFRSTATPVLSIWF